MSPKVASLVDFPLLCLPLPCAGCVRYAAVQLCIQVTLPCSLTPPSESDVVRMGWARRKPERERDAMSRTIYLFTAEMHVE